MKLKIYVFLFFSLGILTMAKFSSAQNIKMPNVSGQFYPADPQELSADIDSYLNNAKRQPFDRFIPIIIAPHAGYVYSGGVAAYSYKAVSHKKYKTIVILAPSHFYGFDGISIWKEGKFQTPLGQIDVDQDFTSKLVGADPKFINEKRAFDREHALEVEIPFLQKTFSDFKIVPVIVGQPTPQTLKSFALRLNEIIGDREDVLIVVSTDLSHYHDYQTAQQMDSKAIDAILNFKIEEIYESCFTRQEMEMCGCMPVAAALLYAKEKGFNKGEKLFYANSGDVTGDKSRVVGYSAIAIYKDDDLKEESDVQGVKALTKEQKKKLINIARQTIQLYVKEKKVFQVKEPDLRLNEVEGAFVTIHKHGQLRGCIGNIIGRGPLIETVRNMAIAAATEDPRFTPVKEKELSDLEIEVSVLSQPKAGRADEIEMGKHGVIISQGFRSGVFLPQVATETGWSKEEFLSELCSQKAGLPSNCWKDPQTKIEIFTADVFAEKDFE